MTHTDRSPAVASRHLVLSTPGRNYNTPDTSAAVSFLPEADFQASAVAQVAEYVRQHGPLEKLTIMGHGASLVVVSAQSRDPSAALDIPGFLLALDKLQQETGVKIADKIVFDACSTMTGLGPREVGFMRSMAQKLDAEIEGLTTVGVNHGLWERRGELDNATAGLSVIFGRDGSVRRGQSMGAYDRYVFLSGQFGAGEWLHGNRTMLRTVTMSDATIEAKYGGDWFQCHDGKTQAEGAACQAGATLVKPKAP